MFEDALLDFFKSKVVAVKDFARLFEVVAVFDHVAPRQVEHELEVVALDSEVRNLWIHTLQARELLFKLLGCFSRPVLFGGTLPKCLEFGFKTVSAQFLLNGAHLLLQKVLALLLVKLDAHLVGDVVFDLE